MAGTGGAVQGRRSTEEHPFPLQSPVKTAKRETEQRGGRDNQKQPLSEQVERSCSDKINTSRRRLTFELGKVLRGQRQGLELGQALHETELSAGSAQRPTIAFDVQTTNKLTGEMSGVAALSRPLRPAFFQASDG